jgi:hypothetical protein
MRKILIFIFVFSFSFLKAQNLQISQVKNLSFSGGVPATSASVLGNVVVPVGKVLKIESSSFSLTNNGLPEDEGSYPKFSAFIDDINFIQIQVFKGYFSQFGCLQEHMML